MLDVTLYFIFVSFTMDTLKLYLQSDRCDAHVNMQRRFLLVSSWANFVSIQFSTSDKSHTNQHTTSICQRPVETPVLLFLVERQLHGDLYKIVSCVTTVCYRQLQIPLTFCTLCVPIQL